MANKLEIPLIVGRYEWILPHGDTELSDRGGVRVGSSYACCGGEFGLVLKRRGGYVDIALTRRVQTVGHHSGAFCTLINIENGRERDAWTVSHQFGEKANSNAAVNECKLLFKVPSYSDAKVTCLIHCFECKSVTPSVLSKRFDILGRDLMELLTSGEDSDVTISVKDREFKVHKIIIRARSPVFFSMLKHDMVEKRTGNVDIPDCDPEVFQKFLEYVYSGELKELSKDIVCSLYDIADKYQVLELKEGCVEFMLKNLSLEIFCDFAALSVLYNELELLESAEKLFVENSKAIVETDGWLNFMRESPVAANHFVKILTRPEVCNEKKRKQRNPEQKRKKLQMVCSS